MKMRQDAINAELDHLSDLGFTMEQFFSEHGPVVVEAITQWAKTTRSQAG
jgi:ABC-type transporter Mla subunit MlaD